MPKSGEEALLARRREKLEALRKLGTDPYPYHFAVTHHAEEVKEGFERLTEGEREVSVAGRIMSLRDHGKTSFAHLQDESGRLQLYLRQDVLGGEAYRRAGLVEVGDLVGVRGTVFRTRTGEITVRVVELAVLAKALRPLPEKWHGLRDPEIRYRQRYLDLVINEGVREVFVKRAAAFAAVRRYLEERGFLEVDTPILQPLYGGALARPFRTHHHALDMSLYLRIANELYLKRLLVGGFERVFEFSRDFRNEGMDRTHNPEFTQVELYQAYADYEDMMELCEGLTAAAAEAVTGSTEVVFRDRKTSLSPPWPRERMADLLEKRLGEPVGELDGERLSALADEEGIETPAGCGPGRVMEELYEKLVQPGLVGPVLVTDFPRETSPLAKPHRQDDRWAERFEPVVFGMELGNAFSELNDPVEQERALRAQLKRVGEGGEESHPLDADFIRALEHGMPPAGGMGIGMDRLVMVLTGQSHIRDVILFPHLRPEVDEESGDVG